MILKSAYLEVNKVNNGAIIYFQKGFNFSQDGPGNRLVYHLYGCNFRCPWCSNPECFAKDTKVTVQSVQEITNDIIRSRPMFFSGGGVTFTGGEPTLQFDALRAVMSNIRSQGIHTALESNGSHERLSELFPHVDYLLMDLKLVDISRHSKILKYSNENVIKNIKLAAKTRQLALRIPLIRGYNDSDEHIDDFIDLIKDFTSNPDFTLELLPYHEYGRVKWQQHSMSYTVKDGFLTSERMKEIYGRFKENNIKIIHT